MDNFSIRFATADDCNTVYGFIKGLAEYINHIEWVTCTENDIMKSIFLDKQAEVILGIEDGVPVGFALFFHNYSSFNGVRGLFLEDLFVLPEMRGKGYGKRILLHLAAIAYDRGCSRMEWNCHIENTAASSFYEGLGAVNINGQLTYRLDKNKLNEISGEK